MASPQHRASGQRVSPPLSRHLYLLHWACCRYSEPCTARWLQRCMSRASSVQPVPAQRWSYCAKRKLVGAGSELTGPTCEPNPKAPMSGLVPFQGRCTPAPLDHEQDGVKEIDVAVSAVMVTCPQP